jgi:transposase
MNTSGTERSLLAGIDLLSGEVLGLVRKRHRSAEFIEFLKLADGHYPAGARIRVVLDNHSAHISKETRAFLGTLPNRFEFTFTPTHGSWLNLIESFFGKMAKTLLRGIRVASADELKTRIELYLKEVNETPVVLPLEIQAGDPIRGLGIDMLFGNRNTSSRTADRKLKSTHFNATGRDQCPVVVSFLSEARAHGRDDLLPIARTKGS